MCFELDFKKKDAPKTISFFEKSYLLSVAMALNWKWSKRKARSSEQNSKGRTSHSLN